MQYPVSSRWLRSELELYLFVPKNFEVTHLPREVIHADFRSRLRLSIPASSGWRLQHLDQELEGLYEQMLIDPLSERKGERIRSFGALLGETIKANSHQISELFLQCQSEQISRRETLKLINQLRHEIEMIGKIIADFRSKLPLEAHQTSEMYMLHEYASGQFVQYLAQIGNQLQSVGQESLSGPARQTQRQLERIVVRLLHRLLQGEAKFRRNHLGLYDEALSGLEQEKLVVRQGQLKKFFQSSMFIDIARQSPDKKLNETTALLGTIVAGIAAAMLQELYANKLSNLALPGALLVCAGIGIYVIRDRLKDWAKSQLSSKARGILPDFEQYLFADNLRLGKVREWFRVKQPRELTAAVLAHRYLGLALDRSLPEDVISYRKVQEIEAPGGTKFWALHENIRLNFERYLKYMDDAYKDMTVLRPDGSMSSRRAHRVYYFYLSALLTTNAEPPLRLAWRPISVGQEEKGSCKQLQTYRVVLDKNGIDRVEPVSRAEFTSDLFETRLNQQ